MKNILIMIAVALFSFGLGWFLKPELHFTSDLKFNDGFRFLSDKECKRKGESISMSLTRKIYSPADDSRSETVYFKRDGAEAILETVTGGIRDDEVSGEASKYLLHYDKKWLIKDCHHAVQYQAGRP